MANNLSFSQQGSTSGYISPLQKATTPSWQSTLNSVQSNYNANPIKTTSIPTNTGSNNQSVIPGLLSTLKTQGGTHTTTDAAGNTQSIKINPLDVSQNPTGSQNTTNATTGVTTGVFPPGSPQNGGGSVTQNLSTNNPSGTYTDPNGDQIDANGNVVSLGANTQGQINAGSANTANGGGTTFPGLIGAAASSAGNNSAIGQSAADIAKSYGQQIADTGVQGARAQAGYKTTGTTPVGEGNAAIQAQSTAAQQTALATGESAALAGTGQQLTAQNQETTGLLGASGQVQPQAGASYFGSPLTGGLVGTTGANGAVSNTLLGSASTGNSLVDTSVENALNQIKNGASTTDAMSVLQGGAAGQQAFLNAMKQYDPNWSITSSNAIASQNMTQGAQYQAQSQNISNALQTMTPVSEQLTSFMTSAGLDPAQSPLLTKQINTINAQTNPDAVATMNAAIGEIKSFASQILASQPGGTPTGVQEAIDSYDFSNFTPVELQTFMSNLNELGQIRLSQAQSAMKSGYGTNNTTNPAAGMTATPTGSLNTGGMVPATNAVNMLKIVGGAGANVLSDALSALGSQASNAIAGAVGGAASSVTTGAAAAAGL